MSKRTIVFIITAVVAAVVAFFVVSASKAPGSASDWSLIEAARKPDVEGVRKAIADGANVNFQHARSKLGDVLSSEPNHDAGMTALHFAVQWDNKEIVQLLLDKGANVELKNLLGNTPLLQAAGYGAEQSISLLLKRGASATAVDAKGSGALQFATKRGANPKFERILAMLREAGATK